jgi:rod shape-determining protein MreC
MNKELFSFLFIFISLVVGALYYTNAIQAPFLETTSFIKQKYHQSVKTIQSGFNRYFYQAEEIANLTQKLENYEENHLVMQQLASEVHDLFEANKSPIKNNPQVELVRSLSYQEFGDFNKLWVDVPDYNASKIYGLVYQEIVAGIVVPKNDRPLALLNKDIKSTYAVSIGPKSAPGIAQGNNAKNILVKYIPAWFNIKEGDEVTTSGLDQIFFKGLKVGKVLSVSKSQGFQTAVVMPYFNLNDPSYFHLIKSNK